MASLLPGSILGRYEIVDLIGRGGMATVYKAHDPLLGRDVAVKVLVSYSLDDPLFLERFTQEAQAIARLSHPNILQVYDFGEDKGFAYIVTEFIPGGTLQDRMGSPLSVGDAVALLRPLAGALDYAHSQDIVHRDIKPSNVLLADGRRPVLADFGLSKVMSELSRVTSAGIPVGTPEYMAPEQGLGRDADFKSDLYSLGVIAYQMLVGSTPFHADTPAATLMAHVHQSIPLPRPEESDLNSSVKAVLLKALAKNPQDRHESATGMVEALAQAGGLTVVVTGYSPPDSLVKGKAPITSTQAQKAPFYRRTPVLITGGVALSILVAVVLVSVLVSRGSDVESTVPTAEPTRSTAVTPQATSVPVSSVPVNGIEATATPTLSLAEALAILEETISQIQERVSTLRVLSPLEKIDTNLRTREQLELIADSLFRREYFRNQFFETEQLYKVLGLMDESADLEQISRNILLQQVSALFDDQSEELYVLSDATAIGSPEKLAYASVYMAGLQQQLFDVSEIRGRSLERGDFDEQRAVTAFLSGEVAQIQEGYATRYFTEDEVRQLRSPLPDNALRAAPNVVRRTRLMPQLEGADFIAVVFGATGTWVGVNQVYARPPVSTEQILHPEKYFANEQPVVPKLPDISEALGRGWENISQNTMGEFLIRTYIEEHLEPSSAAIGADGWGGDSYVLLNGPEAERVFALLVNWDSADDADEFLEVYEAFSEAAYGEDANVSNLGVSGKLWETDGRATFIDNSASSTLLVIADNRALVQTAASAFGDF